MVRSARISSGPRGVVAVTPAMRPPSSMRPVASAPFFGRFGAHLQREGRIARRVPREEIQEIPLRHEDNERTAQLDALEIGDDAAGRAELERQMVGLLMRHLQQRIKDAELVHQLEGRGVDGVAAEIAEEVGVFFQYHDIDAGACQQQSRHHPGRPPAGNATAYRDFLHTRPPCHPCRDAANPAIWPHWTQTPRRCRAKGSER
jgi:hypothetical protein